MKERLEQIKAEAVNRVNAKHEAIDIYTCTFY